MPLAVRRTVKAAFHWPALGHHEIEARTAEHEHRHAQPADDLAAKPAGDEDVAVQVVEEAHPAGHRLLRLEQLERHRIDQDLQAAGERALRRHAALRLPLPLPLSPSLPALLPVAAAELPAFVRHARTRQAHGSRLADLDRPAHRDRDAAGFLGRRLRRLDQFARRAPFAGRLCDRLARAEQMLDVVGVDQHRAGNAHHHQGEHQDQADPEMKLQEPVAGRTALRLGSHRDPRLPNKTLAGDGWLRGGTYPAPKARAIWLVASAAA